MSRQIIHANNSDQANIGYPRDQNLIRLTERSMGKPGKGAPEGGEEETLPWPSPETPASVLFLLSSGIKGVLQSTVEGHFALKKARRLEVLRRKTLPSGINQVDWPCLQRGGASLPSVRTAPLPGTTGEHKCRMEFHREITPENCKAEMTGTDPATKQQSHDCKRRASQYML